MCSMSVNAADSVRPTMLDSTTDSAAVMRESSGAREANAEPPPGVVRRLTLATNFRWTFAGNVVNAACQWGVLSLLARLGTAEAVGQFVLGLAVAAPPISLTMLQLRNVQVTDVRGDFHFAEYFATRIVWTVIGLAFIVGLALLSGFDQQTAWVVVLVGIAKCVDSVSDIVRGLFQREERMDLSGISLMLKGPTVLLAMAGAMWWTGSVIAAVLTMAVVLGLTFVAYDLRQARRLLSYRLEPGRPAQRLRPRFAIGPILRLTWIALPLGIVMALISLQTNIPRYVIQGFSGSKQLGYFGALVYPMTAGVLVIAAMGESASPRLARHFAENPPAFRRLLWKFLALSTGLGAAFVVGVFLLGRPALAIMYGAEYADYHREFMVIAVATAIQFVGSGFGYGLTSARYFRVQVALTIITCLATAGASFALIPGRGVMGACLSVVAASLVMCICFGISMCWAFRQRTQRAPGSDKAQSSMLA